MRRRLPVWMTQSQRPAPLETRSGEARGRGRSPCGKRWMTPGGSRGSGPTLAAGHRSAAGADRWPQGVADRLGLTRQRRRGTPARHGRTSGSPPNAPEHCVGSGAGQKRWRHGRPRLQREGPLVPSPGLRRPSCGSTALGTPQGLSLQRVPPGGSSSGRDHWAARTPAWRRIWFGVERALLAVCNEQSLSGPDVSPGFHRRASAAPQTRGPGRRTARVPQGSASQRQPPCEGRGFHPPNSW